MARYPPAISLSCTQTKFVPPGAESVSLSPSMRLPPAGSGAVGRQLPGNEEWPCPCSSHRELCSTESSAAPVPAASSARASRVLWQGTHTYVQMFLSVPLSWKEARKESLAAREEIYGSLCKCPLVYTSNSAARGSLIQQVGYTGKPRRQSG